MSEKLHWLLEVFFHVGRYHGIPEWPPSPARVFQALVAGAARGRTLSARRLSALEQLELAPPPVVGAGRTRRGQAVTMYMPNNDLDAEDGDPARVEKIRAKKVFRPELFDAEIPVVYLWTFESLQPEQRDGLADLAEDLYQLGRGIDPAWAKARWLDDAERATYESDYSGVFFRPTEGRHGISMPAPTEGTVASLQRRFAAMEDRLSLEGAGRTAYWAFRQPPKPRLGKVTYNSAPTRCLFDLTPTDKESPSTGFATIGMHTVAAFVEAIRDGARERLVSALPDRQPTIDAHLVGRAAVPVPSQERVRIIPLPSLGHPHVRPAIRRVLVEVPHGIADLSVEDVLWAFSGLEPEPAFACRLVPTTVDGMLKHYGIGKDARSWQTVTAAALPVVRRRIDPARLAHEKRLDVRERSESKTATERGQEEASAVFAVRQAIRHAAIDAHPLAIEVRREPFAAHGARAERFEHAERFSKHRLWHVCIRFDRPVAGPVILGDGRYLGLGLMHPTEAERAPVGLGFHIVGADPLESQAEELARAFRRAMLALAGAHWGKDRIPDVVSGHAQNGGPLNGHSHVRIAVQSTRIALFPPSGWDETRRDFVGLVHALEGMRELRAGHLGVLKLEPVLLNPEEDPLLKPSLTWASASPYLVCRHRKETGAEAVLTKDVLAECRRESLPRPEIEILNIWSTRGRGIEGRLQLRFPRPVVGPILLGRNHHRGGGTFVALEPH